MRIFLTGSTGFIGKNIFESLKEENIFYKFERGGNLYDEICYFQPDIIINCAAEIYKEELMVESNILLVNDILKYCKLNKNVKFIQIGSSSEYGKKNRPTAEYDSLEPTNIYDATKGAATLLCQGYAKLYNLPILIVRPYSVYGLYEKSHRFIPRLIDSLNNNTLLEVYHGVHDFIYIKDFIEGIKILCHFNNFKNGQIINFCSGKSYTNREVVSIIQKIFNKKGNIVFKDGFLRQQDTNFWQGDYTKAFLDYGFKAKFSLKQGFEDMKNQIKL